MALHPARHRPVLCLARATRAFVARAHAAQPLRLPEQFADLQEVRLDGVDVAARLAVFGAGADGDGPVLDDVADAEAVARRRSEAELPQRRIPAVGRRQDRVVDPVPAAVCEDGREGVRRGRASRAGGR